MIAPYNWNAEIELGEYILNVMSRGQGFEIKDAAMMFGNSDITEIERILNTWLVKKGHKPSDLQELIMVRKAEMQRWKGMK